MPHGLLERDDALATLDAHFLAAGAGDGCLLVIDAAAGLGKTSLLDAAAPRARTAGLRVARARGIELEHHVPFGVVRQLLEPLLVGLDPERRAEVLDGAAAPTTGLFDGTAALPGVDPYRMIHGLTWVVANLAAIAPLALLVDDAHWIDPASDRFLHYLGPRIADLPVAVLVAGRPTAPVDDPGAARSTPPLAATPGAKPLELGRLSPEAVEALVRRRRPDAPPALVADIIRLTNGNPLVVEQVLVGATGAGAAVDAAGTDLQRIVTTAVLRRTRTLGPDAAAVLEALVVLGGEADLAVLAPTAGLSPAEVRAEVRTLTDLALVAPLASEGSTVRTIHATVREAVVEGLRAERAAELHDRAARALAAAGAPAEALAPHLAARPPAGDAETARVLHEAARRTFDGGDPGAAVPLLRRALAEPPTADLTGSVLADLTRAEAVTRDPAWRDHLVQLRAYQTAPRLATTLRRLGLTLLGAGDLTGATAAFKEALDLGALDGDATLATLASLGFAARQDPEVRRAVDGALDAVVALPDHEVTPAGRALLAIGAYERSRRVEPGRDAVAALARRAVAVPPTGDAEITRGPAFLLASLCLTLCDEWDAATAAVDRAIAVASGRGNVAGFAAAATYRARIAFHTGSLDQAVAEATAAATAARELWGLDLTGTRATLAMALCEQGALADAGAALVLPEGTDWTANPGYDLWLTARCDLLVAEGRAAEGVTLARTIASRRGGPDDNPATIRWRTTLGRALAATGDPADREEARALTTEEVGLARTFGAPRPLAAALRSAAELATDAEERLARLEEAVALLEPTRTGLERVRVRVALGRALRQARRPTEARQPLRAALDEAEAGGMRVLAEAARAELQATGARPRRAALTGPASLTPSEARIARLAAEGLTNRAIAEQLFVGLKTVEYHLANAYPKLGVRGRTQLAAALEGAVQPSPTTTRSS